MPASVVDDLRRRIVAGRVVVVCGSGVSAAATGGHALCSWTALVRSGLDWAAAQPAASSDRMQAARSLLAAGDVESLILAAEIVTQSLGGAGGGEMAAWLRETVGSFELLERAVPVALAGLGVPLATTNYDDLLERATGWERVTWRAGAGAQHALQDPDERVVVHLHGHWRETQSVILGVRSYERLGGDGPAQALQRAMATMSSLLFVGVGDGASDPNFAALRSWLASTFPGSEMRHFRLCLDDEVQELSASHRPEQRIVAVGYGQCSRRSRRVPGRPRVREDGSGGRARRRGAAGHDR